MARESTQEVLGTPELVALILSHLPIHDLLLRAPLVSPTWHQTILTTLALQEALFFRLRLAPGLVIINPLLKMAFPIYFQPQCRYFSSPDIRNLPWSHKPEPFRRKEASWRKMLLFQGGNPEELRRLKIISSVLQVSGPYGRTGYLEVFDGVRMGKVWDLTRNACETEEKGHFSLNWRTDLLREDTCEVTTGAWINGSPPRVSIFDWMREYLWRRTQAGPRVFQLRDRVDDETDDEEEDVLKICLSTHVTCERRYPPALQQETLGEKFQSDAFEKVEVDYGETFQIPNPLRFLIADATRRDRVLAESGFLLKPHLTLSKTPL